MSLSFNYLLKITLSQLFSPIASDQKGWVFFYLVLLFLVIFLPAVTGANVLKFMNISSNDNNSNYYYPWNL